MKTINDPAKHAKIHARIRLCIDNAKTDLAKQRLYKVTKELFYEPTAHTRWERLWIKIKNWVKHVKLS